MRIINLNRDSRKTAGALAGALAALSLGAATPLRAAPSAGARHADPCPEGATDTGRLYFVMELVKSVPITDYGDANQLSRRERLERFMPVSKPQP